AAAAGSAVCDGAPRAPHLTNPRLSRSIVGYRPDDTWALPHGLSRGTYGSRAAVRVSRECMPIADGRIPGPGDARPGAGRGRSVGPGVERGHARGAGACDASTRRTARGRARD